jgi:hypothetical protein
MRSTLPKILKKLGVVSLLFITVFVSSIPAQAGGLPEKTPPGFRDGEWTGSFSMVTSMQTDVTSVNTSYNGQVGLNSASGQVKGDWTLSGTSTYSGDISGTAALHGGGKISGSSTEPVLSTSTFVVDMNITVAGMQTQQSVDMSGGAQMPLTLTSSTCSQVIADIEAPTNEAIAQSGQAGYASGSFVAVRVGDLTGTNSVDYQKQLGELLQQAEALKLKAVQKEGIDFQTLNDLVSKAENLQTAIKKNTSCGDVSDKQFLTAITNTIISLAYFALSNPELFTTGELNRIVMAALGVGAMGSGATDPKVSADLMAKFAQEFTDRLGDAQAGKNCMEATQIMLGGAALGDAALKQQAEQVMAAACGG